MAALEIACPAATLVHPSDDAPSVICGAIELSNDGADIAGFTHRASVPALMSGTQMAGTVENFCAGPGIPGSRCSYTACVIWRAEKHRIAAQRRAGADGLRDEMAARPPASRDRLPVGS